MAVLPDAREMLGDMPGLVSGRSTPNYVDVVTSGRQASEAFAREAEGSRAFGEGVARLGVGIQQFARGQEEIAKTEDAKATRLAASQATADFLTNKIKIDQELGQATDSQTVLKSFPQRYESALNSAAQYIQDPEARALFIATHKDDVARSIGFTNERATKLYNDQYIAGLNETINGLGNAGVASQNPKEQALVLRHAGQLFDDAAAHGVISMEFAQKAKERFKQEYSYNVLEALPADRRMSALRPVNVDAGVTAGMKYFMSKGWTQAQAAGIMGNLLHESGGRLNPNARAAGDGSDGSDSIGIGQWNSNRAKELMNFAAARGKSWNDFQTQLEFVQHELETNEAGAAAKIRAAGDVESATEAMLGYERPKGWEGGLHSAYGGVSRLHYAKGIFGKVSGTASDDSEYKFLASTLPPDKASNLYDSTVREISQEGQIKYAERRQMEATVRQQISDDWASVTTSGKTMSDLTPERVEQVFGKERRIQFEAEREIGKDFYTATNDFDSLPATDIKARLDSLRPTGDTESTGFKVRAKLYADAEAKAKVILKERNDDPAAAADRLPNVAAIKRDVDLGGDVNAQRNLVRERMKAFEVMGIPAERQVPVTRQEAKDMMAPVIDALPGQEKAALQMVVPKIKEVYGDEMTGRILGYALRQAKADAETQEVAARVMKKIGLGQPVSSAEVNQIDTARTNDAMSNVGKIQPAQEAAPKKNYPVPPDTAIQALIGQPTPDRVQQFETIFGPGSAKRILDAASAQSNKGGDQ